MRGIVRGRSKLDGSDDMHTTHKTRRETYPGTKNMRGTDGKRSEEPEGRSC